MNVSFDVYTSIIKILLFIYFYDIDCYENSFEHHIYDVSISLGYQDGECMNSGMDYRNDGMVEWKNFLN